MHEWVSENLSDKNHKVGKAASNLYFVPKPSYLEDMVWQCCHESSGKTAFKFTANESVGNPQQKNKIVKNKYLNRWMDG